MQCRTVNGHFGTDAEVSRHIGTGAEISNGHFGTGAEMSWCRSVRKAAVHLLPPYKQAGVQRIALYMQ